MVDCSEPSMLDLESEKRKLLSLLNICDELQPGEKDFQDRLIAARIACLSEIELYFLDDPKDLVHTVNPRNESAALSMLLEEMMDQEGGGGQDPSKVHDTLAKCLDDFEASIPIAFKSTGGVAFSETSREGHLQSWSASNGISMSVSPASFTDTHGEEMRGLVADSAVEPGQAVITVPTDVLISSQTAAQSDLGQALQAMGVADEGMLAVIWTLVDRYDDESKHKEFWDSLPGTLNTGLSFPEEDTALLQGTAAYEELLTARQHIKESYESVQPLLNALLGAYSDFLKPEQFTWEAYLWATQLWYAYAMEVEFPDGGIRSCLVPYASLMNHSPYPHVVRYGKIHQHTNQLRFRAFRACKKGEECLLSYGPLPNQKLLIFYGFVVQDNPLDTVQIDIEVGSEHSSSIHDRALKAVGVGKKHHLRIGPVPKRLIDCARILVATETELCETAVNSKIPDALATQRNALDFLETLFNKLVAGHSEMDMPTASKSQQMIKTYKQEQLKILQRSIQNVVELRNDLQ